MLNKKNFQIGWYDLKEDKEFMDNGYECAGWYKNILVKAGKYPVMSSGYDFNERDRKYTNELENRSISICLNGLITSSDFNSRFCGNVISYENTNKDVNKESEKYLSPYCHEVAEDILENKSSIELFPEFQAQEINFMYNNEQHKTYGIFNIA